MRNPCWQPSSVVNAANRTEEDVKQSLQTRWLEVTDLWSARNDNAREPR